MLMMRCMELRSEGDTSRMRRSCARRYGFLFTAQRFRSADVLSVALLSSQQYSPRIHHLYHTIYPISTISSCPLSLHIPLPPPPPLLLPHIHVSPPSTCLPYHAAFPPQPALSKRLPRYNVHASPTYVA